MSKGVPQASGEIRPEPTMDTSPAAKAVVQMASLPLDANISTMTLVATQMPYIGRARDPTSGLVDLRGKQPFWLEEGEEEAVSPIPAVPCLTRWNPNERLFSIKLKLFQRTTEQSSYARRPRSPEGYRAQPRGHALVLRDRPAPFHPVD